MSLNHQSSIKMEKFDESPINSDLNNTSILSLENDSQTNMEKSPSKNTATLHKCVREGSRIIYTDLENITMLKKLPEKKLSDPKLQKNEIFEKLDSYRSGESLFKTFTFEQTKNVNDPETQACITFWKNIMEKNLAPIKCTLFESDTKNNVKNIKTKKKKEKKVIQDKKEKQMLSDKSINDTPNYEELWNDALKEIKKKHLNKMKLSVEERCRFCKDPLVNELLKEDPMKAEEVNEIKKLNEFVPNNFNLNRSRSRLSSIKKRPSHVSLKNKSFSYMKRESTKSTNKSNNKMEKSIQTEVPYPINLECDNQNMTLIQTCPCTSFDCICQRHHKGSIIPIKPTSEPDISLHDIKTTSQQSNENVLLNTQELSCNCEQQKIYPWDETKCSNKYCTSKNIAVNQSAKSSNSDNLNTNESNPKEITFEDQCICHKKFESKCLTQECNQKFSQGSLITEKVTTKDSAVCTCKDNILGINAACKSLTCTYNKNKNPLKDPLRANTSKLHVYQCAKTNNNDGIKCSENLGRASNEQTDSGNSAIQKLKRDDNTIPTNWQEKCTQLENKTSEKPGLCNDNKTKITSIPKNYESAKSVHCFCENNDFDVSCKVDRCTKRFPVTYSHPCLCEKYKDLNINCDLEKCETKLSTTCICLDTTEQIPCTGAKCKIKPSISIKPTRNYLHYDTSCICRQRGAPQDTTCNENMCPYKVQKIKNATPPLKLINPIIVSEPEELCTCTQLNNKLGITCRVPNCINKLSVPKKYYLADDECHLGLNLNNQKECICDNAFEVKCEHVGCAASKTLKKRDKCTCTVDCATSECILKSPEELVENQVKFSIGSSQMAVDKMDLCFICGQPKCKCRKYK